LFFINIACHNSCEGLNRCYGPMADECCNYNNSGNCTVDCGDGRIGNSTTFYCEDKSMSCTCMSYVWNCNCIVWLRNWCRMQIQYVNLVNLGFCKFIYIIQGGGSGTLPLKRQNLYNKIILTSTS